MNHFSKRRTLVNGVPVECEARNDFLTSIAGTLVNRDLDPQTVRAALLAINQARYGHGKHRDGPLSTDEIDRTIMHSVRQWCARRLQEKESQITMKREERQGEKIVIDDQYLDAHPHIDLRTGELLCYPLFGWELPFPELSHFPAEIRECLLELADVRRRRDGTVVYTVMLGMEDREHPWLKRYLANFREFFDDEYLFKLLLL